MKSRHSQYIFALSTRSEVRTTPKRLQLLPTSQKNFRLDTPLSHCEGSSPVRDV